MSETVPPPSPSTLAETGDREKIEAIQETGRRLRGEIAKVIIGQEEILETLHIALFSGGHALLIGEPENLGEGELSWAVFVH